MTWLMTHPWTVLSWSVLILCTSYVIGAAVYFMALAHEERKADEQRQVLERAIAASRQQVNQNLQLLHASKPTRAAGLKSDVRRVS